MNIEGFVIHHPPQRAFHPVSKLVGHSVKMGRELWYYPRRWYSPWHDDRNCKKAFFCMCLVSLVVLLHFYSWFSIVVGRKIFLSMARQKFNPGKQVVVTQVAKVLEGPRIRRQRQEQLEREYREMGVDPERARQYAQKELREQPFGPVEKKSPVGQMAFQPSKIWGLSPSKPYEYWMEEKFINRTLGNSLSMREIDENLIKVMKGAIPDSEYMRVQITMMCGPKGKPVMCEVSTRDGRVLWFGQVARNIVELEQQKIMIQKSNRDRARPFWFD